MAYDLDVETRVNFYKHYLGDYARDTAHLSLMEHGAYRVLLDTYYAVEKPLPADGPSLYRICKAFSSAERKAVDLVATQFFPLAGDGFRHNARADEEIAEAKAFADAQAKRAHKRWHQSGNAGSDAGSMPAHMPDRSRIDASHSHSQRKTTPLPPSGAFLRFWDAWPANTRKQSRGKCWDCWRKGSFDLAEGEILAHVEGLKLSMDWRKDGGAYIPAPLVYLHQRRWEGADPVSPKTELRVAMP